MRAASPILDAAISLGSSRTDPTFLPSTDRMTSPVCRRPSAGPLDITCATRAPSRSFSPSASAISGVTGWIDTPSHPRST